MLKNDTLFSLKNFAVRLNFDVYYFLLLVCNKTWVLIMEPNNNLFLIVAIVKKNICDSEAY